MEINVIIDLSNGDDIMKIYQLDNKLKRIYYNFDEIEKATDIKEVVKIISKNRDDLQVYDNRFMSYAVYVEKIPKKICKFKEITIVIDELNDNIRYFSSLCN